MRAFVFIATTLAVVLAVSAVPSYSDYPHIDNFVESRECVPNRRFYNQCNLCHCSPDGKSADCSMKACPGYNTIRIDNYVHGHKCPAKKSFYNKCNLCYCSDGLSAGCSIMGCPEYDNLLAEDDYPHIDNFAEIGECVPNTRFYNQCNLCRCSPDGKSAACNLKECSEYNTIRIDNYVNGMKCPSNRDFQNKCNICRCSSDGLSAVCSLIACRD